MVHLPASGVLFTGDVMMPYLGQPFAGEGSPEGLLEALAFIGTLRPRLLIHGHPMLTEQFTAETVPGLEAALTQLHGEVLDRIRDGRTLPGILQEASLPAVLRDHPTAVVPYLVIRDHFTERPRHPDVHPPGPRQRPISVAGDGSQTRSVCYVDDTVDGILRMHSSNIATLVNIGTPDERSVLDIARDVIAATGSRSAIAFVDRPVDDPRVRRPETTRARELLGWEPAVPWSEGLTSTISWFRTSASPGTPSSQAISARVAERLAQDSRN